MPDHYLIILMIILLEMVLQSPFEVIQHVDQGLNKIFN